MTTLPVAPSERHSYIPVELIDTSSTNPRTHFDQRKLDELAESILRHGVLQPILVRPRGERYELVAGERRFRASRQVAIASVPAIVRELDDKQVLEIQVVENLQRADLHPLEEAEGYAVLIRSHGYDADSLALKIGKSRSYVYGRMKLAELCDEAKELLYSGKLTHSVALLIARIPDAGLQQKALKKLVDSRPDVYYTSGSRIVGSGEPEPIPYRLAKGIIASDFQLRLKEATFDTTATIVADGALPIPCTTCPNRSGNQSDLFDDFDDADVCTLPTCFRSKEEAAWQAAAAKKKGVAKVLTLEQGKKIAPWGHVSGSAWIDVKNICREDPEQREIAKLLPKDAKVALVRDGYGREHKVIAKKDLAAELARAGHEFKAGDARTSGVDHRQPRDWELEDKIEKAVSRAIVDSIEATALPEELEELILRGALLDGDIRPSALDGVGDEEGWAAALSREQLFAHLAESLYSREPWGHTGKERRAKLFAELGLTKKELAAIEKRVTAEHNAPKEEVIEKKKARGRS